MNKKLAIGLAILVIVVVAYFLLKKKKPAAKVTEVEKEKTPTGNQGQQNNDSYFGLDPETKRIHMLVDALIDTLDPTKDGSHKRPRPLDTATLNELLNLNPAQRELANKVFYDRGGIFTSDNYGASKNKYRQRNNIAATFPAGNRLSRRNGAGIAKKVQALYGGNTTTLFLN